MIHATRRWLCSGILSACALLCGSRSADAQIVADSLIGKVTDARDQPVNAALVLITQRSTGAAHQAQTNRAGTFVVPLAPTPRGYSIVVTAAGFATARLVVQRDSTRATRQTLTANFKLVANATQLATVKVQASRRPRFGSPDDERLHVGNNRRDIAMDALNGQFSGDLGALVGAITGITAVDGGFSVLGLGADQNMISIGGTSINIGALPRDALANATVSTTNFNATSGGYSGAQLALSTFTVASPDRSLRFMVRPQALSSSGNSPSLSTRQQNEYQLGGSFLGPMLGDRGSYAMSFQYAHVGAGSQGLDVNRSEVLQDLGLSTDSVNVLNGRANALGIVTGLPTRTRSDDRGSLLLGANVRFNADRTANTRFIANASRISNDGLSPFTFGSAGSNSTNYSLAWSNSLVQYVKSLVRTSYTLTLQNSRNSVTSLLDVPAARVQLASASDGTTSGEASIATVSLGGNPNVTRPGHSVSADLLSQAGWMSLNSKHEFAVAAGSRIESIHSDPSRNLLGTFNYATLSDFMANQPSSFVRTINGSPRDATSSWSWAAFTDSWRPRPSLTTLFGARYEFGRILTDLPQNDVVRQKFGVSTSNTPQVNRFLPRFGFSWDIHQATVKSTPSTFDRARPRGVLSGGYGLFVNGLYASSVNPVLGASGTDAFNRELRCEGAGVPVPDWNRYAAGNLDLPTTCSSASGSAPVVGSRNRISAFANNYEPTRSWRGSLSWRSQLSEKNSFAAEFTHSLNFGGTSRIDANLQTTPRYFAAGDGGRAVFVRPVDIVPANGLVPLSASRLDSTYSTVSVLNDDLRSTSQQLRLNFRRNIGRTTDQTLAFSYAILDARSQTRTPSDIANDVRPNVVIWSRSPQDRHYFTAAYSRQFLKTVGVTWLLQTRGGGRYTPIVNGDINGDGLYNDRPFITSALANSTASLLATPRAARDCLQRQEGRIARINSCDTPWNTSLNALISIASGKAGLPGRLGTRIYVNNLPAAADLLLHGSKAKGWGAPSYVDPTLLTVRGYDAANRQFQYAVNPRFGQRQRQSAWFGQGARVTIEASLSLSPDPLKQRVAFYRRGNYSLPIWNRATADEIFANLRGGAPTFLRSMSRAPDSVALSASQRASLDSVSKEMDDMMESAFRALASDLAAATTNTSEMGARLNKAQRAARLEQQRLLRAAQAILTTDQIRKMGTNFRRLMTVFLSAESEFGGG